MKNSISRYVWLTPIIALVTVIAFWPDRSAEAGQSGPTRAVFAFPSCGIIDGEMLRVTVANPEDVPPGPCRITLLDTRGNRVADSGEFQLPAGETTAFNSGWGRLAILPEERTGRKQFRVVVTVSNPNGLPSNPIRPGVELIQMSTGHTFALLPPPPATYPAGPS